jgi:hypothetical protein
MISTLTEQLSHFSTFLRSKHPCPQTKLEVRQCKRVMILALVNYPVNTFFQAVANPVVGVEYIDNFRHLLIRKYNIL